MDVFKGSMNETVDLDDLDIFLKEWKEMDVNNLFLKCMAKAGTSLFYMDFLHPSLDNDPQSERVKKMCKELVNIWYLARSFDRAETNEIINEKEYRLSLMKWLYRFDDEVENQC